MRSAQFRDDAIAEYGEIEPIRLNFSHDAIAEEDQPSLGDFPSLKDLETSNLFSNRFHGELANKFALKSLGVTSESALATVIQSINDKPITFADHIEKTGKTSKRDAT